MTIVRVNPGGWGFGVSCSSAQGNQLDLNTTYALDKRAGQTDTLQSVVQASAGGRIIGSYAVGADVATTYLTTGGNTTIDVSTLTANRSYTLGTAGAVAGDILRIVMRNTSFVLTVIDGATTGVIATLSLGSANSIIGDSTWGEFLYTGAAWVRCGGDALRRQLSWSFTSSGTWVCPPGIGEVLLIGWGGGGGGGGGGTGSSGGTPTYALGGSGGGGAAKVTARFRVTPGTSYAYVVAPAGNGGGSSSNGIDGGDTMFSGSGASFIAVGAQGGAGGVAAGTTSLTVVTGGSSSRLAGASVRFTVAAISLREEAMATRVFPQYGGASTGDPAFAGYLAGPCSDGSQGGASGPGSSAISGYNNGGSGGGGGAGNYDAIINVSANGGNGAAGGGGISGGSGFSGSTPTAPIANTGAGGGGGSAGGQGSAGGGNGAAGAAGASGFLIIYGVH